MIPRCHRSGHRSPLKCENADIDKISGIYSIRVSHAGKDKTHNDARIGRYLISGFNWVIYYLELLNADDFFEIETHFKRRKTKINREKLLLTLS